MPPFRNIEIKINLTTKFVVLFLIIALIPLAIGIFISYDSSKRILEKESANYLYGVLENRISQIESYFLSQKEEAKKISSLDKTIKICESLNEFSERSGLSPVDYSLVDRSLALDLEYLTKSSDYNDFLFFSLNNQILFSKEKEYSEEKQQRFKDILTKAEEKNLETQITNFKYYPEDKKISAFIFSPILRENQPIGFLLLEINQRKFYYIFENKVGLGETGEVFISLRDGNKAVFISPLKNVLDAPLNRKIPFGAPTGEAIQKSLQGEDGWGAVKDYQGKKVLAVWRYLPAFEWGIVAKIEIEEVLESAIDLKNRLLLIALVLLIMIVFINFLLARSISNPIRSLTAITEKISQGNLTARAKIKTGDEIEKLGNSFNLMTEKLIQSQNELQKKFNELFAVLNSISDGVFVLDQNKNIKIFNPAAEDISDFKKEEIIGKKCNQVFNFVSEKNKKEKDNFIDLAMEEGIIKETKRDTILIKKNKEILPVAGAAAPLKNEFQKIIGCVIVFRDILKEREIDKAKTEFVSLASHQLRTPLSTVNWYSEMLLNEEVGKINEDQKKYLQALYGASRRMVSLVNALLNVSRIELGTFSINPEPVDFIKIVKNVLEELEPQIKIKNLEINEKYDFNLPIVNTDQKLLKIILQNLVSNSVKYTRFGGKIDLGILKQKEDVLIKVEDNGYGIPKKQQSKIFTKFFRANNILEKDTNGNGLGLYIVQTVVGGLGGKIWFESEENKRTCFYVSIPIKGMKYKSGNKILLN